MPTKEENAKRYLMAAHAVQSAIAFRMGVGDKSFVEPKHLRVGIDTAKVEHGALASLLIEKGIFTEAEYIEAIADAMEVEVGRQEKQFPGLKFG